MHTDYHIGKIEGYLIAKEAPLEILSSISKLFGQTPMRTVTHNVIEKPLPQKPEIDFDEESGITSEKPRKPRKALSPENKAALVKRLAVAREKKLANLVAKKRAERPLRQDYESKN